MDQLDMWGGISEPPVKQKQPTHRYPRMQERYGCIDDQVCGTCANFVRHQWNRVYFKCSLWVQSHSVATDIRYHDKACGKWVPDDEKEA